MIEPGRNEKNQFKTVADYEAHLSATKRYMFDIQSPDVKAMLLAEGRSGYEGNKAALATPATTPATVTTTAPATTTAPVYLDPSAWFGQKPSAPIVGGGLAFG